MSLIVYEPVIDGFRELDETDLTRFSDAPQTGQSVAIGSQRRWSIVAVETYQHNDGAVYLALIHPEGADVPDRSEWTTQTLRSEYENLSYYLQMSQKSVLSDGWAMNGVAPTGRLDGRPWAVDIIETYKPIGDSSYTAIHICHCVPVSLPEMAVA